jgi:hydrogenase maturation protease
MLRESDRRVGQDPRQPDRAFVAPLLVLAVGNPSRGDDALGPWLLDHLAAGPARHARRVELMTDFQLQVEHAVDLVGRRAVLFVDAARPAAGPPAAPARGWASLERVRPEPGRDWTTHALSPQRLLAVYEQVTGHVAPPAWVLAIEGRSFELGEPLSDEARLSLARAVELAARWILATPLPRRAAAPLIQEWM